jgi:large repetitive protein
MASSNTGTISITVSSVPDAPVVVSDNYSLNQDTTLYIPVMSNDSDVDSTILSFTGYTNPSNGSIIVSGTGFSYIPNTGYIG